MKDKPSEWVSISDLMAGVMAVVMLLLVVAVLQKTVSEMKLKSEVEKSKAASKQSLSLLINNIRDSFKSQGAENIANFDLSSGKITLKDNVFGRGSACITSEAKLAFAKAEQKIAEFLIETNGGAIYVEGHTDNLPVKNPVTDISRFCTVYDDNYTLSAARAREARRLLVGTLDADTAKRIIVAGYGDSQPLTGISPQDDKNRRVEVRFAIEDRFVTAPRSSATGGNQGVALSKEFFNEIMRLATAGKWSSIDEKIRSVTPAQSNQPGSPNFESLKKSGLSYLAQENYPKAIEALGAALAEKKMDFEVLNGLGLAKLRSGKAELAIEHLFDSLLVDPSRGATWLYLSQSFALIEKSVAADASLLLAVHFAKDKSRAIENLQNMESSLGNDKFIDVVKKLLPVVESVPKFKN
ncbi:OmpA family protein [Macromonas bipunctata]|jgi:chemotaxis protein MotB|uniref:OmpA family protein n=1 Tax=Macromonas bipunctata TaxID=183670 RepID=UPI000C3268A0|nr:OmpA family protein [Macromonas bipunctata]